MSRADWKKLNEIFDTAVTLEPQARNDFLQKIEDENLRREVEAILDASRRAAEQNFLEADGFIIGAKILIGNEDIETDQPTEKSIGKYRIIREIGRGGMGAVFLAEREDFRQTVALKIIKRGMDTEEIIRRFRRERDILASLNHPLIARLLDGGTTDRDLPFFVMEHVEGLSITEFCDLRKLNIAERLKLFRKVCAAVAYAHQNSIVHRDLKPSNILVGEDGEPKLLDFGISKLLASDTSNSTIEQTAEYLRLMTPEYASPEQIRGEAITTASDIYSLGVLLYELLTGHRPLKLKNRPTGEIIKIVSESVPSTPSIAALTNGEIIKGDTKEILSPETIAAARSDKPERLKRKLAGDLDNIVLMSLRKEPALRYESVEQFSQDLHCHLEGLPVLARPAGLGSRAGKFIRRNRMSAVFAAIAMLATLVAVGTVFITYNSSEKKEMPAVSNLPRSIAVLPFMYQDKKSEEDEYLANGLTNALTTRLSYLREIKVRPADATRKFFGSGLDAVSAGRELSVESVIEGEIKREGELVRVFVRLIRVADGVVLWSDDAAENRSDALLAPENIFAVRLAAFLSTPLDEMQIRRFAARPTENPEAYQTYLKAQFFFNTRKEYEKAEEYFRETIKLDRSFVQPYVGLASIYAFAQPESARGRAAEPLLRKALELNYDSVEARSLLGFILAMHRRQWHESETEFKRALRSNPNYATGHQWYATNLTLRRRFSDAETELRKALEIDPLSLSINADLCEVFYFSKRFDEAIAQCKKTLELDAGFFMARFVLAKSYFQKQMYSEAADFYLNLEPNKSLAEQNDWRGLVKRYIESLKNKHEDNYEAYGLAYQYAVLGDRENTLRWLEKADRADHFMLPFAHVEPAFEFLRGEPRFQNILRRVNLPER